MGHIVFKLTLKSIGLFIYVLNHVSLTIYCDKLFKIDLDDVVNNVDIEVKVNENGVARQFSSSKIFVSIPQMSPPGASSFT